MPTTTDYDAAVGGIAPPAPKGTSNPYEDAVRLSTQDGQQRLRTSVFAAGQANPDTAARARKIAERTGMAPDAVERNLPTAERQVLVEDIDSQTSDRPALRNAYSDPYFAKVAKDDLFNLTAIEKGIRALLDPNKEVTRPSNKPQALTSQQFTERVRQVKETNPGVSWDEARALAAQGVTLDNSAGGIQSSERPDVTALNLLRGVITQITEGGKRANQGLRQMAGDALGVDVTADVAKEVARSRNREFLGTPEPESWVGQQVYGGVTSVASQAPGLVLSVLAKSPAPWMASAFGQAGAPQYQEVRERGGNPLEATMSSTLIGGLEVATEFLPTKFLTENLGKRGFGDFLAGYFGRDLIGEEINTILSNAVDTAIANPNKTWGEYLAELPEAMAATAVQTFTQAGVMGAINTGLAKTIMAAQAREFKALQAEQHATELTDLLNAAMGSKLRERDPQTFAAFAQAAADEAGSPLAQVHVDATILAEVLKQSNVDLAAFAQMSPTAAEALQDAIQMGGSVAIPIGDLLGKMGDSGIETALLPHLRASEDALSQEEAKAEQQAAQTLLQQNSAAIVQQAADSQAVEQSVEKVREVMFGQLQAAGRFSPDVNRAYATMVGSFYTVLANDMGVTPEQAYAAYPLRVQGVGQQSADDMEQDATAFNTWFEGSKVVDDAGAPLRVYTGTSKDADFKKFNTPGNGVWFTADPEEASAYAKDNDSKGFKLDGGRLKEVNTASRVLPVYLNLKNPMVYDVLPDRLRLAENYKKVQREVFAELKAQGYDGVIIGPPGTARTYVAFNATQIKSAIGNDGTYDVNDPSILSQSARAEGDTRYRDRAVELLADLKIPARSAVAIMDDTKRVPLLATNFDIARYFTRTDVLDISKAPGQKAMVDALYADTLKALTDAGSAVGWYDRKVTAALNIIAEEHPEILTDEQAKFGFITMLAITSNSTKVNENFEKAEALYRQWKTTGEWPVDVPDAKAADAMREGLQTMKDLVAEHGWQKVRDFMVGDHPRADIEAFSGGKIASELADSTVYGAVFLGSKIGAFFNNLYGNFTPVTMDRWFMRTANRVRGEMLALPESFPEMLGKLSDQIREGIDDTYGQDPEDLLREIEAYVASGETGVEKTLRALPTVLAYSKARFNVYARGITDSNGKKRAFVPRTRENVLAKGLYEALTLDEQTPNGGGDRVLLRKVMHMLQSKLATAGIPIEMADLQAVLWYYEKDLFAKLKGEKAQANLFDGATEEAEDYETAARRTIDRLRGTWAGDAGPGRPAKRPAAKKLVAVDPTLDLFAQGAPGEGGGGYSSGGTAPLEGAPNVQGATGPDPRLVAVAEKYAASRGITLRRQAVYVDADPERGARIAQAYADMKHAPGDPEVAEAYASMIEQTRAQYDALVEAGYSFTFFDSNTDPYGGNPWNAMRDLRANQHMAVYGTYDGYGTEGVTGAAVENNPMLATTGLQWPDQAGVMHDVTANDLFRAVHDAFGHGLEGAGFRAQGEENAWQAHVRMFQGPAALAITSETRGQNSWLNFGPYGETNRTAGLENTVFAEQKTGLMPAWTLTEGRAPDLIGGNEMAERATQRKLRQAVDLQLLQQKPSEGADVLTQDGITKPGEVQLTGVHFSIQSGLQYLNGQYYGKGLKGAERERVYNSTDTRLASRTYFYVDEGKGVRPEAGVGGNAHEAQLTNLYDINADPLKLIVGGDTNATESNILNAGFDGYYVRNAFNQQGAAVVIGQASRAIPVTPIANPTTAAPPLPAAPQVYKRGLMASELNKIDIDAIKTVAPSARLSAGTFQVLESEREAAAAMAASQGVELPVRYSQGKGTRGTYSPKSLTITLLENADLSTFLHETGHFMLEAMASVANTADAPVRVREDMAILLSWFGVKDLQTWLAMDTNGKRPYHEKFAESFEQYLFEGKAPSKELQPLFQRFTAWFERVYQSLTQFLNSHNTKLTDEVRAVFDRMLATKEQIEQKQEEMAYTAMFTARPEGMTDDQYVEWMMANQMATGTAEDELRARSLRDLRWVLNARARELVKLRKGVAEKRKAIEDEVRAEVAKQPVYAVQRWIKTGVLPDGTQQTGARLNTEDLRAIFGDSPAAPWRYLATNLISASREDSLHPDVIAEMFGFTSGDQMVREIVGAYPEAQTIEGMTDNRVLERHGDIASQRAMDDAANEAVHNKYRAKVLASELKAMTQATQPVRLMLSAAKSFANQLIGRRKVKDIKPFEHERAEERAAKRGATATAKGELAEATAAKRDQVLQFHAAKAAREALAEVKQARELFEKIVRGKSDDIVGKTRDMDLVNATRAILANYGFGGKAKSAHDYLMVLKDHDPAMFDTIYDRVIMAEQSGKPFNELTMDELRALVDEVKSFWLLAKRTKQIEIDGKLVDLEEAQNALAERIDTLGIPLRAPGEGQAVTPAEKRLNMLQSFIAAATRVESWITAKDGGPTGVFRKYVFNTIKDAADAYRADRADYATRYTKLLATVGDTLTRGVIAAPELNYTFGKGQGGVGMSELLHAILHTGNESNKRKLLLGRKWATEKPDGTLDTTKWDDFIQRMIDEGKLQKKHFDFAQGVWDMLESTKAQAQKMHRDVFGRYFAEVTADGFTNQFGNYRGGYVPAMADPGIVSDAKTRALAEEENQSLAFAFPTTNKGFTKARVEYNRPLVLDLRTLSSHLDKVLMFSHLEGPVRDVRRLLTGKGVAYALNRQDPVAFDSILTPWLNRTARQIVETPVVGDAGLMRFFSAARNNAGMAAMFANVTNAAQQLTGFSIAATQVPPRLLMSAMASYLASPSNVKKTVKDSSPYMAGRMDNEVAAMHDAMRDILLDPNVYDKAKAWSRKHAYFLQAGVDNVITPMVWLAAYNHALEQKMDTKEARRHADSVVRTTQGSTLPEDVSRIETGNAFVRMFTQFMGYFNMQANLLGSGFVNISRDMGLRNGAGKALGLLFLGALAPAWVAEAIAQGMKGGPGDEDDDGWYLDDWIKAVFGYGTIRTATAMVPVAGQIINAAVNATNSKTYDDRIGSTPAISMIESTVRSPISVYKALVEDGSPQKAVRDVATAFSMATGIPVSGAARPLGYLAGMEADDIDPTSGADLVRGLITGTASPESKE